MNDIEIVEQLTDIMARQSHIIRELHSLVTQLNAVASFDPEITKIQDEAKTFMEDCETGGHQNGRA